MSIAYRKLSDDWGVPTSIGIWGGTATTRSRLALVVARRIDPEFYWLQTQGGSGPTSEVDPALAGRVPKGHLFFLRPGQVSRQTPTGPVSEWFVRSDVESETRLNLIGDFMKLPTLARNLIGGGNPGRSTKALVIADSNLAESLLSLEEGGIRPFIEALNKHGLTMITTLGNRPNPNARDIDYLLYIRPEPTVEESGAPVEVRQGSPPGVPGLFTVGTVRGINAVIEGMRQGRSKPP